MAGQIYVGGWTAAIWLGISPCHLLSLLRYWSGTAAAVIHHLPTLPGWLPVPASSEHQQALDTTTATCQKLGVPLALEKILWTVNITGLPRHHPKCDYCDSPTARRQEYHPLGSHGVALHSKLCRTSRTSSLWLDTWSTLPKPNQVRLSWVNYSWFRVQCMPVRLPGQRGSHPDPLCVTSAKQLLHQRTLVTQV